MITHLVIHMSLLINVFYLHDHAQNGILITQRKSKKCLHYKKIAAANALKLVVQKDALQTKTKSFRHCIMV